MNFCGKVSNGDKSEERHRDDYDFSYYRMMLSIKNRHAMIYDSSCKWQREIIEDEASSSSSSQICCILVVDCTHHGMLYVCLFVCLFVCLSVELYHFSPYLMGLEPPCILIPRERCVTDDVGQKNGQRGGVSHISSLYLICAACFVLQSSINQS